MLHPRGHVLTAGRVKQLIEPVENHNGTPGQQQQVYKPGRRRALMPLRWYHDRFTLEGRRLRIPVAHGRPTLRVRLDRDLPYPEAFAAYEKLRRPRVEKVIAATNRKNSAKAAGPVLRTINAWAITIFAKLAKPEKMTWVFHHNINWDEPV